MTATGCGSDSITMTFSAETASPAPAGHKCGPKTKAWTTRVAPDRASAAPAISRSEETRMHV